MAKAKQQTKPNQTPEEVKDVSTNVYSAYSGAGFEEADSSSFAIPFLLILQKQSPILDKIENAKAGMFYNTVNESIVEKAAVVPCYFRRTFLRWIPINSGGGFGGEVTAARYEKLLLDKSLHYNPANGIYHDDDGFEYVDTRMHYVLLFNAATKESSLAVISLSSTQLKYSKRWMAWIEQLRAKTKSGDSIRPPMFAYSYLLSTFREENSKGSWFSLKVDPLAWVTDPQLFKAASQFYEQIRAGAVKVDHTVGDHSSSESNGPKPDFDEDVNF